MTSELLDEDGDVYLRRGINDPPQVWQFLQNDIPDDQEPTAEDVFDLTGSVLYLKIVHGRTTLVEKNSTDDADVMEIDIELGTLTWTPTLAETRSFPLGRLARYEIERRIGTRQGLIAWGSVIVTGGLNDD